MTSRDEVERFGRSLTCSVEVFRGAHGRRRTGAELLPLRLGSGRVAGVRNKGETTPDEIVRLIVGVDALTPTGSGE